MAYVVEIAAAAERDAEEYYAFILRNSQDGQAAIQWWDGLMSAVLSLEHLPSRCPKIPETGILNGPLYQLIYQSHRLIFRIDQKEVRVLRIYHGAARPLTNLRQRPKHRPGPES